MTREKRRQYGTGSLYQRADGRWIGAVMAGWSPSGTRRRITVSGPTEAAVKAKLRKIDVGDGPAGVSTRTTVKTWADQWLAVQTHRLRPKTVATNASAVKRWIVPTIGRRKLADLTPGDLRKVADAIRDAGRSTTTAHRTHVILKTMLKDAIAEGHAVPQRVLVVGAPARAVHDRAAIPLDDALALLTVAAGDSDGSRWVAGMLQGMRQAERLGLTWPQVDLDANKLTISWQCKALPYDHGCGEARGGRWPCGRKRAGSCPRRHFRVPDGYEHRQLYGALCLVRPKSRQGWRVQPIVPWMRAALIRQHDALEGRPNPHDLVWPRPGGQPETASGDTDAWYELQDRAQVARVDGTLGRRYHGHEMRHTTATLLMALGVPETVRITIMGHSSITTTHGYEHADLTMARAALEKLASRLQLAPPESVTVTEPAPPAAATPADAGAA